jgi:hypothetical protein
MDLVAVSRKVVASLVGNLHQEDTQGQTDIASLDVELVVQHDVLHPVLLVGRKVAD